MTDVQTEATEAKRTRYTGEVTLEELGEEEIDLSSSGMGRGRPSVDLTPYKKVLTDNFKKNSKITGDKKIGWKCLVNTEAVGTVKSRFNTAAAEVNVGVTYRVIEKGNGKSEVTLVTQKRAVGRGRPKKESAA